MEEDSSVCSSESVTLLKHVSLLSSELTTKEWLSHSSYADIFPYRTPVLHSAFSVPTGVVTTDTTDTEHTNMMNQLIDLYRIYHSLSSQYCTCALTTCDISLCASNK